MSIKCTEGGIPELKEKKISCGPPEEFEEATSEKKYTDGFIIIGGSEFSQLSQKQVMFYDPNDKTVCKLPSLPIDPLSSTLTGLTVCGGINSVKSAVSNVFSTVNKICNGSREKCLTFNLSTGEWDWSYSMDRFHEGHVAWNTSKGILLMGGYPNWTSTTLLLPNGKIQPGFQLKK